MENSAICHFSPNIIRPISGTTDLLAAFWHSHAVGRHSIKQVDVASDMAGASACGTWDRTASYQLTWDMVFPSPGRHGGDRLHPRNTLFPGHLQIRLAAFS